MSINDRGWLVRQWTWPTRTGSAPPRLPTSRAKPRFLWATSFTTSRPKTRLARRSSSGGWHSYPRSGSDGAKPDRPRIGSAPASKASSRTRIPWHSTVVRSGRFAPSSTRRAARSPPERPKSSLNTWPGSRASFGHSGRGKTPTALRCTCFPPCKAFRSWLIPFMTPVLWRWRPSASRVGFKACETPRGLNPQAHRAKPDAGRLKYGSDDTASPKQAEWSFYENYFDWRKRKDRRTGSKGIGGGWPWDSQGRAQIRGFSSRERKPGKC